MKTYIVVDSNDYVVAMADNLKIEMDNCTTYVLDGELDHSKIDGYIYKDNQLIFNQERFDARQLENKQWSLRNKREQICFSVVNRGDIWYEKYVNTEERKKEFEDWYQAWLDVTDTMVEPETPEWIV